MSSHEREERQGEVETGEESSRHETEQEAVEAGREEAIHDPTEHTIPLEDAIRERIYRTSPTLLPACRA
jgi:hypothetical protein